MTSGDSAEIVERIQRYQIESQHYLTQAAAMLQAAEPHKAGEFAWGALVAAVNAVSLLRQGRTAQRHGEVVMLLQELARGNPELDAVRKSGERLLSNFYHQFLDSQDVAQMIPQIEKGVRQILTLAYPP